jgi:hypothetical protein
MKEINMSFSLVIAFYVFLGLALSHLRRRQGMTLGDAAFCGLFWPFDLLRRGIDLLVRGVLQADAA